MIFKYITKYFAGCGSLSMKGLTVPGQLILGSGASLGCDYNLEGSKLYSVKWYKDGQEFFRFMPSMDKKIEVFSVRGVNVDVSGKLKKITFIFYFWRYLPFISLYPGNN